GSALGRSVAGRGSSQCAQAGTDTRANGIRPHQRLSHSVAGKRRAAWTVILVPPRPGEPTRQLTVSTRTLAAIGTVALAFVGAAATWTGETTTLAANTADRLAESQRTVVALLASVQSLQAAAVRASRLPPRDMILPVVGEITSRFSGSRLHPILQVFRAHLGVDVSAPAGTAIVAPAG